MIGEQIPSMQVNELIDESTKQWDRGNFFSLFTHRTCVVILAIPLNNTYSRDQWVWKENRSQSFFVKSAYQVALRLRQLRNK